MSTLAIVVSLLLLMVLSFRGYTVLLLAPAMAAVAVLLSGDAALLLPFYTDTFMSALGRFAAQFFPLFALGALFGQLMADSGAAQRIAGWIVGTLGARHAILTIVLACAVLTYGGVSLFVVAFAMYPIAHELFRSARICRTLIPSAIALGSFTFTMTAMPGTPAIQNAIPIPYYGTNTFAAPGLGLIGTLITLLLGMGWLIASSRRIDAAGRSLVEIGSGDAPAHPGNARDPEDEPISLPMALLPLGMVLGLNALCTYVLFPALDLGFLRQRFPALVPERQVGMWGLILALTAACATLLALRAGHWRNARETINKGVLSSVLPTFNTASVVGYGAVIAGLAGFSLIRDAVLNVAPGNPLVSEAVAMNVLAAITGSSSGGLSIALQALGGDYLRMAQDAGVSPDLLHRVAVMSAGCLDTLPHCGAIITLLAVCGLDHRQCYGHLAMVTIPPPMLALVVVVALGTLFGSF